MSPNSDQRTEPPVVKTETEARQGETPGRMRYVLMASTGLSIVGILLVYFIFFSS